jgi:hypothetical protein
MGVMCATEFTEFADSPESIGDTADGPFLLFTAADIDGGGGVGVHRCERHRLARWLAGAQNGSDL